MPVYAGIDSHETLRALDDGPETVKLASWPEHYQSFNGRTGPRIWIVAVPIAWPTYVGRGTCDCILFVYPTNQATTKERDPHKYRKSLLK